MLKPSLSYEQVLDNLFDGVYLLDTERRITFWNKGAQRIAGYTPEEVLNRSCGEGLLVHTDANGNRIGMQRVQSHRMTEYQQNGRNKTGYGQDIERRMPVTPSGPHPKQ